MSCTKGCCDTQAEHYRSLRFADSNKLAAGKSRVDRHDTHTVTVTESGDRQDVAVKFDSPLRAGAAVNKET